MWRLWDMDSQEEQWWDNNNEASDAIPVLASDHDENVIFVVKAITIHTASMHHCQGCYPCPAYLFQVQPVTLPHFLVSIDQVFYFILINIFLKAFLLVCINKKFIIWHILLVFFLADGFCFLHPVGVVLHMDHDKMVPTDNMESSILDHLTSNAYYYKLFHRWHVLKNAQRYFKFGMYWEMYSI